MYVWIGLWGVLDSHPQWLECISKLLGAACAKCTRPPAKWQPGSAEPDACLTGDRPPTANCPAPPPPPSDVHHPSEPFFSLHRLSVVHREAGRRPSTLASYSPSPLPSACPIIIIIITIIIIIIIICTLSVPCSTTLTNLAYQSISSSIPTADPELLFYLVLVIPSTS